MAYGRAGNMDEEMRRFEMELAGGNSQNGHFPSSSYQQSSNGFQTPVSSVASAPVRFIPHQLQRNRATTQTQQQSQQQQPFMVHAPPQPAQITSSYSFPTLFNPQLVPSMFPRMASQQVGWIYFVVSLICNMYAAVPLWFLNRSETAEVSFVNHLRYVSVESLLWGHIQNFKSNDRKRGC